MVSQTPIEADDDVGVVRCIVELDWTETMAGNKLGLFAGADLVGFADEPDG